MSDKWDEIEAAAMAEITGRQERASAVLDEQIYRIYRETYKAINELARAIKISDPFPESEFGQWTLQVIREDLLTLSETEALQKYKAMAREILGQRLESFGDRGELIVRLKQMADGSEMWYWALDFLSGTVIMVEKWGDGARDGQRGQKVEFIGWCGTTEQLERLADELQKEKFVASAEAFKCQFKNAGSAVEGSCKWLRTDRSLLHLLEKLLSKRVIPREANIVKEAIAHFCNKDGNRYADSLSQNRSNARDSKNKRGFGTIDTIISEVLP